VIHKLLGAERTYFQLVRLAEGEKEDDTFYSHLSQVLEGTSSEPTPPTAFCDVLFSSKNAKAGLFDPKRHTDQESIRTGRPGKVCRFHWGIGSNTFPTISHCCAFCLSKKAMFMCIE